MFQQFYEPHPALKGFGNNIMIYQADFNALNTQPNFSIPTLPEHCIFFYVKNRSSGDSVSTDHAIRCALEHRFV
jgi:hypothetical protein